MLHLPAARTAYLAAKSVVSALADGSLHETSTAAVDALPDRGPFLRAPNEEEHAG